MMIAYAIITCQAVEKSACAPRRRVTFPIPAVCSAVSRYETPLTSYPALRCRYVSRTLATADFHFVPHSGQAS